MTPQAESIELFCFVANSLLMPYFPTPVFEYLATAVVGIFLFSAPAPIEKSAQSNSKRFNKLATRILAGFKKKAIGTEIPMAFKNQTQTTQ
jgi:hypothetical protein